jgi:hypothetical protein
VAPVPYDSSIAHPFDAALPYTTTAAAGLACVALGAIPAVFGLGASTVLIVAALARALAGYVERERLRAEADAWLVDVRSPNTTAFAWRAAELLAVERGVVGRTLGLIAEEMKRPRRSGAPVVHRARLPAEVDLLAALAHALQDPTRTPSPRAVVRSRLLVTDAGSPLNSAARSVELRETLESILDDFFDAAALVERHASPPVAPAARPPWARDPQARR